MFAMVAWTVLCNTWLFAQLPPAQFNARQEPGFAGGNSARNSDAAIVRPSGYSVQQPVNGAVENQPPPAILVQPNGQRVFTQSPAGSQPFVNSQLPNGNSSTGQVTFPEAISTPSSVQPASWTKESASSNFDNTKARTPLELKPRSKDGLAAVDKPTSQWAAGLSMLFSLTIVVCLFLMIAWLFRKSQPTAFIKLPIGVVQVMGRTAMAPRQQVYVVRFGSKLLLVSHQPGQTQTLCEITDVDEVQRLAGMCEANQPNSISHSFRDIFRQVASGKPETEVRQGSRRRNSLNEG
jgi:flagellar biogenesis protein FliO